MKQTAIAALVAANVGRAVIATTPEGDVTYRITRCADKMGSLKSGEKAEFVIITKDGDDSKVISLHPNNATKLFKAGKDGVYTLGEPETAAAGTPADLQAETNAELNAAAAGATTEGTAPTTDAAPAVDKKAEAAKKKAEAAEVKAKAKADAATKREADKKAKEEAKAAEKEAKLKAKPVTAKDLALQIFKAEPDGENKRKNVIAKLKEAKDPKAAPGTLGTGGLGMGAAGANTYYQNMKGGTWA